MSETAPGKQEYTQEVQPVNYKQTRGEEYVDRYTFGEVHFDFDPSDVFADSADARVVANDAVRYQYGDKTPVMITPDSVHAPDGADRKEAEKQAYFALSYLKSAGYVTGWRKLD